MTPFKEWLLTSGKGKVAVGGWVAGARAMGRAGGGRVCGWRTHAGFKERCLKALVITGLVGVDEQSSFSAQVAFCATLLLAQGPPHECLESYSCHWKTLEDVGRRCGRRANPPHGMVEDVES